MNNTTQSSFEEETSSAIVLKAASLLLFILVGVSGNGRIIYAVLVDDVVRPVLNVFVASLGFAHLASCLIIMPFPFMSLVSSEWLFGYVFCIIHNILFDYFRRVSFLSITAMIYERYQAIYRKRFPTLSNRQISILLCIAWFLPILLTVPKVRHEFVYNKSAGICFNAVYNHDEWNIVFNIRSVAGIALGLCLLLFSFWKCFAFLFSFRRRRVSPELLSNEEKLIRAAHVYSA